MNPSAARQQKNDVQYSNISTQSVMVSMKMIIPCDLQLGTGPGRPFIVCASETLGANPDLSASSITASTSDFHHSPANKK